MSLRRGKGKASWEVGPAGAKILLGRRGQLAEGKRPGEAGRGWHEAGTCSNTGLGVLAAAGPAGVAIRARQLPGLETMSEPLKRERASSRIEETEVKSELIAVNFETDRREQCLVLLTSQVQLKASLRGFCFKAQPQQDSCFGKDGAAVLPLFLPLVQRNKRTPADACSQVLCKDPFC